MPCTRSPEQPPPSSGSTSALAENRPGGVKSYTKDLLVSKLEGLEETNIHTLAVSHCRSPAPSRSPYFWAPQHPPGAGEGQDQGPHSHPSACWLLFGGERGERRKWNGSAENCSHPHTQWVLSAWKTKMTSLLSFPARRVPWERLSLLNVLWVLPAPAPASLLSVSIICKYFLQLIISWSDASRT